MGPISRYLTGACLEDVNHEIYGGLYSQMIFGESFQEPAPPPSLKGFKSYSGRWIARDGVLDIKGLDGPKLISDRDQGLLFLNPSQVWLQPPGYVVEPAAAGNHGGFRSGNLWARAQRHTQG